jgi:hypothetical protein
MGASQKGVFQGAMNNANTFSGAAQQIRGSIKQLQRRQSALESLRSGDSSLLSPVHRVGAGMLASLLFAGLGLVALASAAIHPLLSLLFLPFVPIAPWVWWRNDLQPLGAALRDHPGVFRSGAARLPHSPLYPLLCTLALLLGAAATAAATAMLWQYGGSLLEADEPTAATALLQLRWTARHC